MYTHSFLVRLCTYIDKPLYYFTQLSYRLIPEPSAPVNRVAHSPKLCHQTFSSDDAHLTSTQDQAGTE